MFIDKRARARTAEVPGRSAITTVEALRLGPYRQGIFVDPFCSFGIQRPHPDTDAPQRATASVYAVGRRSVRTGTGLCRSPEDTGKINVLDASGRMYYCPAPAFIFGYIDGWGPCMEAANGHTSHRTISSVDGAKRAARALRLGSMESPPPKLPPGVQGERRTIGDGICMPTSPRVSVVIPTLNEGRNLPHVFERLPYRLYEVIVVDGFSTDNTVEVAQLLRSDVKIVMQERPGKGDALRCGFEAATGDVIVMLDADGSADPVEIPAFVRTLVDGADFAKGSRFRDGGGSADITKLRRVGNRGLNGVVNVLFGTSYSDLCYGYNAFWRHCLDAITVDCTGFEVETLINIRIARAGLVTKEVASFEGERIHGQSNLRTFHDGWRVLRTILRERVRPVPGDHQRRQELGAEVETVGVETG